jgi:hypothetical protein
VAVETSDPTWDNEAAATWSILELNMGIVCSCLPTLRPLVTRIVPKFWTANAATLVNHPQRLVTVPSRVGVDDSAEKPMPEYSQKAKAFV